MISHPLALRRFEEGPAVRGEHPRVDALHSSRVSRKTPHRPPGSLASWKIAGITGLVVTAWLGLVLLVEPVRFVIFNPRGKTGIEMFLALGQLFGALVLALSSGVPARPRVRWVSTGLLILGVGGLGFGYLRPLFETASDSNVVIYGSLFIRGLATALIAIGLVPTTAPSLSPRMLVALLCVSGAGSLMLTVFGDRLPVLVRIADLESMIAATAGTGYPGLTGWYLGLGLIPMAAGVVAIWGAVRHDQDEAVDGWLIVAVVLLTGGHLHALFWPSMYSSILTTTSALRVGSTVVIVVGGIIALRTLSLERMALLADEHERLQRLEELSVLKRDFNSMVAHELSTPLAAIANLAQMISLGVLAPTEQTSAADRIQVETRILQLLVRDIQASADVERDDFVVRVHPVTLGNLLGDAQAYARAVQTSHSLAVDTPPEMTVLADPERIGQVIRNLLNNAIRHTPPGTSIVLGAVPLGSEVRIEIRDLGPGIDPADHALILEKYGRGHHAGSDGRGLGLYLSQRILLAHGTELTIESEPGHGACFSFRLKESP